jgi:hypothetical protein
MTAGEVICMRNPFTIGIIDDDHHFCNRIKEKDELKRYAMSGENVVMLSPRRLGKSSLVGRVQKNLANEGFLTIYVDFFSVISEQDVISRIASAFAKAIGKGFDNQTTMEKVGQFFSKMIVSMEPTPEGPRFSFRFNPDVKPDQHIEDMLADLQNYVTKHNLRSQVTFDEFQEITVLPESKRIEGSLRSQIQHHRDICYFFVGSRRRMLQDMFSNRNRPFYKSAFQFVLEVIPLEEFTGFIMERFQVSGKSCSKEIADYIYNQVRGYSYYVQKLSFIVWELTENQVVKPAVQDAYMKLIKMEEMGFTGIWGGLTLNQKKLLRAIAEDPTANPYGMEFIAKHHLSVGGVQSAMNVLRDEDNIEQVEEDKVKTYRVTDPVFGAWVKNV